jgi:2-C-methyl-D-erythritol 4-phosphate cytidylyltransferase
VSVHALIPAAGRSVRFGGTTLKQYAHLLSIPVIAHSIEAARSHPLIGGVTVVLAPDDGIFEELVRPYFPDVRAVSGGDSRAESVMNGLRSIRARDPACETVVVHDAARPCLPPDALARLLEQGLASEDGAILSMPVSDTLKRAGPDGRIASTLDRSDCWAAQTPQLFRLDLLIPALESALEAGEQPTDEAAAMERAGYRPLLVRGSGSNIKITGPEDLALAQFILQRRSLDR